MDDVTYQIHWLSFTVKAEREDAFTLYKVLFKDEFGPLQDLGNGGRGFKEIFHNSLQVKLYLTPSSFQPQTYWHLEIPGQACENISPLYFLALGDYLESNFRDQYSITRLDFAFDHVSFTPEDVEKAIKEGAVRTLAKRESQKSTSSFFAKRDNGEEGTYTVEFGSNLSDRMITVYNRRGYTRLEFQCKDDRAQMVGKELLQAPDENQWFKIALSHLRDYVDFETDWWAEFVSCTHRAFQTVSKPSDVTMNKLVKWLDKQVSPALSVAVDVLPKETIDSMLNHGRRRRGGKWDLILETAKGDQPDPAEGSLCEEGIPAEKG